MCTGWLCMAQKPTESFVLVSHKSKWCCSFSVLKDMSLIWIEEAEFYEGMLRHSCSHLWCRAQRHVCKMGLELPQFLLGLNQEKLSEMSIKASVYNWWVKKKNLYNTLWIWQNKPECISLGFIGMLGNNAPCISVFTTLLPQPWELCETLCLVIVLCRPWVRSGPARRSRVDCYRWSKSSLSGWKDLGSWYGRSSRGCLIALIPFLS